MDIKEIQNLIKFVAKSGASEVKLEMDDIKITIRTGSESDTTAIHYTPVAPQIPQATAHVAQEMPVQNVEAPAPAAASGSDDNSKYITIKSPIIGTFYRKPAPDKPLFVEVGQTISEGDVLCVIEAMKLFNEIESEVSGKIVKVLVDDSSPVEFDQPLFLVDPS
ncbi:acetyl-CoA carboxylase biotin carboxyl carrier protein subunit [Pseudalgibacter alginicilyticus]|uniref:Biotin carboxyl carrier protein of acetyl-CoA carboxylase n=1 Tax=Pseudalgibacter alginicilyticus TaxID=1736674 RepID=A0A0P0CMD9_9FLAO|nr:acetyl-CoA carboxylase biotin carboxyl carrier protein [Pseudalgibacter alginicilyticus]ALJ05657.1 acetyl-CoA carboxylase biotin carboxyl carrier protein subunit [Pseudalgibacter alginicilyticus]